ncbi:MAG: alpha/beta fold hydrolase [Ardenticatenia bacterium]|nr:alpha/beta fold hydrolase [Ardenticatenia bacterium]
MAKNWFPIAGTSGSFAFADPGSPEPNLIVFAHGYSGDPDGTWERFPNLILQHGQGFEQGYQLASFGYDTRKVANREDLDSLTDLFKTFLKTQGNKAENIFIIAHSLGGLLARRLLLVLHDSQWEEERQLYGRIQQLHFLGVPHHGAAPPQKAAANIAKVVATVTKPINYLAWQIRKDSKELAATLDRWLAIITEDSEQGSHLPTIFNYVGHRDWVAPLTQVMGDLLWTKERYDLVSGSHSAIPKPANTTDEAYKLIRDAILKIGPVPDKATRRYLEALFTHCQSLPLTAMGQSGGGGEDMLLEDVYIEMNTTALFDPNTGHLVHGADLQASDGERRLRGRTGDTPENVEPYMALKAARP